MMRDLVKLRNASGLSMPEVVVALLSSGVLAAALFMFLNTSTISFAKNFSTNSSHATLRSAVDRVADELNSSAGNVTLITTTGTAVTSGSAAGFTYDRYLGGPYVVTHPGGTGLAATATSLTITRSLHASASPPVPKAGDVVRINGSAARLVVASVSSGTVDANNRQSHTVTLTAAIGSAITWNASDVKIATLIRKSAFVVIAGAARNELRYFATAETITNFSTSTAFSVICNNVGTGTGDTTPFSVSATTDYADRKFITMNLKIRAREFDTRLLTLERKNFSAVTQMSLGFTPKGT
ncbi:MAG: hypothetical protein RL088_2907 [Verrucomicrobiota bacterium]|jgi:hypothetical protein